MAPSSPGSLSPSIIGAIVRFRRLVILVVAICAVIALIYTGITGSTYTAKAQLVIQQPPTFLPPFPVSGSHTTAASYVNQQVAVLESQAVSYGAASIVNAKVSGANVTGDQIHSGLTVKPQTGAAAGTNNTTQVLVTMPTAELAAASANVVVASYIAALHGQIRAQADQSLAALDKEIASVNAQLASIPAPTTGTKPTTGTTPKSGSSERRASRHPWSSCPRRRRPGPRTQPPLGLRTRRRLGLRRQRPRARPPPRRRARARPLLVDQSRWISAADGLPRHGDDDVHDHDDDLARSTSTSGSSSSATSTANQRVPLLATLTNLTRSRSQVQVDEQADLSYIPTVFPATIPSATSNGNLLRNFVIGALIGLLIAVIAAYAMAVRRRQFEHAPEPELMYGVPLISAVPAFNQSAWLPTGLPILTEPAEEPAEQIRIIATALRSIRNSHPSLVMAFSSATPRSGTTAMVANTGLALAKDGGTNSCRRR